MTAYNLADLWETLADAAGDAEVLVGGDVRLSYAQLEERANRLANALANRGVQAGDHVGVYSYNRVEFVESLLAIFKLRAVPINVNYRYVESELLYILDDSEIVALIYERGFNDPVRALQAKLPRVHTYVVLDDATDDDAPGDSYEELLASGSPERRFGERSADDHYVIYTGGTTGMPKGTVWRHEDIFFGAMGGGAWNGRQPTSPEDIAGNAELPFRMTYLVLAPVMHGAAQWLLVGGMLAGARVVLYTARHFEPAEVLRLAEGEQVSSFAVVGDAMGRPLAEEMSSGKYDLSKLLNVGSGGAVLSDAVKAELRAAAPQLVISDTYGSSELGAGGRSPAEGQGARFTVVPEVTVLDEDTLRPIDPGSGKVGKLARRGHIPLGYWKDEAKTAETFPVVDGVRWVVPGDYGTIEADGTVVLFGRGSQCINTGGEKVFPEEVEATLKAHPAVFDAIVVGVPDERWHERVVAVVAPRPGRRPSLDDLVAHCRASLAGYKVPRALVLRDQLQRTLVGKPDYAWAREVAAEAGT